MKKGDIKYAGTKKVVVVEPAGEGPSAIVQEVYVAGDEEHPAGATFFARDLKDEFPSAITWEGRQIQREKEAHQKSKNHLERLTRDIEIQVKANVEHLSNLRQVEKLDNLRALDRVVAFLAGDVQYVALMTYGTYGTYKIEPFVDAITNVDSWQFRRYDGLKLMTLTGGRSSGRKCLNWNLNQYSDGSGSNTTVIPCKTKQEAVAAIQRHIDTQIAINAHVNIDNAQAVGCTIPKDYIQKRLTEMKTKRSVEIKTDDATQRKRAKSHDDAIDRLEAAMSGPAAANRR